MQSGIKYRRFRCTAMLHGTSSQKTLNFILAGVRLEIPERTQFLLYLYSLLLTKKSLCSLFFDTFSDERMQVFCLEEESFLRYIIK
jgi:hypothetical protein